MKIVSKFKDFYDFAVVKYGMDEKLVYNRKTSTYINELADRYEIIKGIRKTNHMILLIGDKIVHLFKNKNKIFTHYDVKEFNKAVERFHCWNPLYFE